MSPDPGQDSTYQSEWGYQPSAQRVRPGNSHLTGSHFMEKSSIPRNFFRFLFLQVLQVFFSFLGVGTLLCVFYELTVSDASGDGSNTFFRPMLRV